MPGRQRPLGQRHRAVVAGEQRPHPRLEVGEVERAQGVAVGDEQQLGFGRGIAGQGQVHGGSFRDAGTAAGGRLAVDRAVEFVEPADAAEPRRQRDLGERELPRVDQPVGLGEPLGLRHGDRRCADMLAEQPPHLPFAEAEPVAEILDLGARRACPRRSGRARDGRWRRCPARRRCRARRRDDSACRRGSPQRPRPQPWRQSGRSSPAVSAPDRPGGRKSASSSRR